MSLSAGANRSANLITRPQRMGCGEWAEEREPFRGVRVVTAPVLLYVSQIDIVLMIPHVGDDMGKLSEELGEERNYEDVSVNCTNTWTRTLKLDWLEILCAADEPEMFGDLNVLEEFVAQIETTQLTLLTMTIFTFDQNTRGYQ